MTNLEEKIADLEEAIYNAEISIKNERAEMPSTINDSDANVDEKIAAGHNYIYAYIGAALIPLLTAGLLYLLKPKFIMKSKRSKKISTLKLAQVTGLITIVAVAILVVVSMRYPNLVST